MLTLSQLLWLCPAKGKGSPQHQDAPGSVPSPTGVPTSSLPPNQGTCVGVSISFPLIRGPLSAHSAAVGIGFYGNSETNDGVYQLLYALDHANHTLTGIDSLVGPWDRVPSSNPLHVPQGHIPPPSWVWFKHCGGRSIQLEGPRLSPRQPCRADHRVTVMSPCKMGPLWPGRAVGAAAGLSRGWILLEHRALIWSCCPGGSIPWIIEPQSGLC